MNTPIVRSVCGLVTLFGLFPAVARGDGDGVVQGNGSVEIKRSAEILRVQVEVLAKGKDLKEALAKLKDRKEAALAQLVNLGVPKQAVEFTTASASAEADGGRSSSPYEMMLRDRISRAPKKAPAKDDAQPPVLVSATLKADVPLKADGPEELLLVCQAVQEKLQKADLGGLKELAKGSPQEEEAAEEDGMLRLSGRGDNGPRRGEPTFIYVAKLSNDEHHKALTQAFGRARQDAERLARAAGLELGPLKNLGGSAVSENRYSGRSRYYEQESLGGSDEWRGEVLGLQPTSISLRITVTTAFALKPAAGK